MSSEPAPIDLQTHPALAGITVLERGWLSSNNLLVAPVPGEAGATLIDTGHVTHVAQTLALVEHALGGAALAHIVNTHLHSDHCGGNAALQRRFSARLSIPPGQADAVRRWDDTQLSHAATGQRLERFVPDALIEPGTVLEAGGCRFEVHAAPGHDPDAVLLFERARGLLVSADALWEHGFGVVFPEIAGEPGFDDVGRVLDLIEALPVRLVVPGHGAPFTDVASALGRARARLQGFQREPARHARHAAKVLVKYHLMEERAMPREALLDWVEQTPLMAALWESHGRRLADSPRAWAAQVLDDLVAGGALRIAGDRIVDA